MTASEFAERFNARRCGKRWVMKCPAHADRKPSLTISEGKESCVLLKCFAGCEPDGILSALGLTKKDLFPERMFASANPQQRRQSAAKAAHVSSAAFDWQKRVAGFTDKYVAQLAEWRGYSPEFVRELREHRHIGIHKGLVAFSVHNNGRIVGTHFRLKDGTWQHFPTGIKAAPLVFGELTPGERVNVFESTWDGLAYMDKSGERDGIVITRGAGNAKFAVAVVPQASTAYLWTQNDEAGTKWERDFIANAKCACKRVKIPAHDLNDWIRDGASSPDLLAAVIDAETLREPEKSWDDALAESEVTAAELHNLELMPRKKLLGDWFAEGDCGFIFAFRGVGKTWLALAIAQALATGGKLGDWQASEPVNVLYFDSEMPADLMRERCDGLGGTNDE
jgi:hypothetical protein